MLKKILLFKKDFWLWAILAGLLFAVVALVPQIGLRLERGDNFNGTYAVIAYDEPAYAAYLQSIIDGKPRRNSPYSGRTESAETPQQESLFSIQFFSTYPLAIVAKIFGLSASEAMILLGALAGFGSAVVIFWLFYLFSQDARLSFVGTIAVLFGGTIAAGQSSLFALLLPDYDFIEALAMPFLRRTNPAVSFPVLFLFFATVWKFLHANTAPAKTIWAAAAALCYSATVYSYFFHWTTALAWFFALALLWAIFQFADFRRNIVYFIGLGAALLLALVPYFVLLSKRATNMDSVQLLVYSRNPDLWRFPELISYAAIALLLISFRRKWLDLEKSAYVFLLSLTLVAPIVFNQQILTNRSLQPFHYQLFCVNYISAFVLLLTLLMLMAKKLERQSLQKAFILIGLIAVSIGYLEISWGYRFFKEHNVWADELTPAARRIKSISAHPEIAETVRQPLVMSFDLDHGKFFNGTNLPAVSSQAVLWSPHLSMFPDIDEQENTYRLNSFLYYQNFSPERLRTEMNNKNGWLLVGFFGTRRISPLLTTEYTPVSEAEIDQVVEKYREFCLRFGSLEAQTQPISFVLIHSGFPNDLTNIDRWYERDAGEPAGKYIVYRVRLRKQ